MPEGKLPAGTLTWLSAWFHLPIGIERRAPRGASAHFVLMTLRDVRLLAVDAEANPGGLAPEV
jgi:hypothetical protein